MAKRKRRKVRKPQPRSHKAMPRWKASKETDPKLVLVTEQSKVPRPLLTKRQMLARVNVTYPTVWKWMREGKFPRARVLGARSMWFEAEVQAFIDALPIAPLKGDAAASDAA
jgi:predicted DNA-binding transcriptional regulator AlpA